MPEIVQGRHGGAGIQTQVVLSLEAVLSVTTQESFRMWEQAGCTARRRGAGDSFFRTAAQMNGNAAGYERRGGKRVNYGCQGDRFV